MAKKTHFIRIRVDEDLKNALRRAADLEDRQEADQARHLLRRALGLSVEPEERGASRSGRPEGEAAPNHGRRPKAVR